MKSWFSAWPLGRTRVTIPFLAYSKPHRACFKFTFIIGNRLKNINHFWRSSNLKQLYLWSSSNMKQLTTSSRFFSYDGLKLVLVPDFMNKKLHNFQKCDVIKIFESILKIKRHFLKEKNFFHFEKFSILIIKKYCTHISQWGRKSKCWNFKKHFGNAIPHIRLPPHTHKHTFSWNLITQSKA